MRIFKDVKFFWEVMFWEMSLFYVFLLVFNFFFFVCIDFGNIGSVFVNRRILIVYRNVLKIYNVFWKMI